MLRLPHTPHNGGAKDGEIKMSLDLSGGMVGMERLVGRRSACPPSLATAAADGGHALRGRPSHGHHLAPCGGDQRRLLRLLLLPGQPGTQDRNRGHAVVVADLADIAVARTTAGGDRRLADQTLWSESRGSRYPSQSHARAGRSTVPLRPHLGDDFVGSAPSAVGPAGVALAGDALCATKNHCQYSPRARLE